MNPLSLSALGNHLWQSTVVTAVAGLLALMLRKYAGNVRYWVWFTASVKFLVPFSLLISLGSGIRWQSAKRIATPRSMVVVATEIAQPFVISTPVPLRSSPVWTVGRNIPTLLFMAWLVGVLIIVSLWARSWWRMRAIVRGASPVAIPPDIHALASPALLEPSVFGIFRPVLLLPHDIQERLSEEQLHSVVAHEMCHIRRRDNLLSSVHMTVAAIFWFYPVVWWLGARLLEQRERACDEQVVRRGSDPHAYAEGILRVCKSYLESPLRCASGVSGANLQRRIEAIICGSVVHKLDRARVLLLLASGICTLTVPVAVGIVSASPYVQDVSSPRDVPQFTVSPDRTSPAYVFGAISDFRVSEYKERKVAAKPITPQADIIVAGVQVRGNRRVPRDSIRSILQIKVGDQISLSTISRDIRALYSTGYFDDVQFDTESAGGGTIITVSVKEKPLVRAIEYKGIHVATVTEIDQMLRQSQKGIALESAYSLEKATETAEALKAMLAAKGYAEATVGIATQPVPPNGVDVVFVVDEGPRT